MGTWKWAVLARFGGGERRLRHRQRRTGQRPRWAVPQERDGHVHSGSGAGSGAGTDRQRAVGRRLDLAAAGDELVPTQPDVDTTPDLQWLAPGGSTQLALVDHVRATGHPQGRPDILEVTPGEVVDEECQRPVISGECGEVGGPEPPADEAVRRAERVDHTTGTMLPAGRVDGGFAFVPPLVHAFAPPGQPNGCVEEEAERIRPHRLVPPGGFRGSYPAQVHDDSRCSAYRVQCGAEALEDVGGVPRVQSAHVQVSDSVGAVEQPCGRAPGWWDVCVRGRGAGRRGGEGVRVVEVMEQRAVERVRVLRRRRRGLDGLDGVGEPLFPPEVGDGQGGVEEVQVTPHPSQTGQSFEPMVRARRTRHTAAASRLDPSTG